MAAAGRDTWQCLGEEQSWLLRIHACKLVGGVTMFHRIGVNILAGIQDGMGLVETGLSPRGDERNACGWIDC